MHSIILYMDITKVNNKNFLVSHGYIIDGLGKEKKSKDAPNKYMVTPNGYKVKKSSIPTESATPSTYFDSFIILTDCSYSDLEFFIYFLEKIFKSNNKINIENISEYKMIIISSNKNLIDNLELGEKNKIPLSFKEIIFELSDDEENPGTLLVKGKLGSIISKYSMGSNINDLENYNIIDTASNNYWYMDKSPYQPHPLCNFKQEFFTNINNSDIIVMDYPSNTTLGKKTSEALFGRVRLKNPRSYVDNIYKRYKNIIKDKYRLYTSNMGIIYSFFNSFLYHRDPANHTYCIGDNDSLLDTFGNYIIHPIKSPGLSTLVYDKLNVLGYILDKYLKNNFGDVYKSIDISEHFYKDSKCLLGVGESELIIDIKEYNKNIKIPLVLGIDLPDRNSIKKMENENTKVFLILEKYKDSKIAYYYIIIDTDHGIGVYTSLFSNKIIL